MKIYYDDLQEGVWFQALHARFSSARLIPITGANEPALARVLSYDRPDVILTISGDPVLVVERTVEVPSGHNVGQRFARLVAAAQARVPVLYFGPYAAYKHGGLTQGPRYMNLRLFYALDAMAEIEGVSIATVNWPVDDDYEIRYDRGKDDRVHAYLEAFLGLLDRGGTDEVNRALSGTTFSLDQSVERESFIRNEVVNPAQYDGPPNSVSIEKTNAVARLFDDPQIGLLPNVESVLYRIGMTYVRSDPYTGMAMLYLYLYAGGMTVRHRNLILHFPHISIEEWRRVSVNTDRKDVRLYRLAADGIVFEDGFLPSSSL